MTESKYRETRWGDILGRSLSWIFASPTATLRSVRDALDRFSKSHTGKSPLAFLLKPLRRAAQETVETLDFVLPAVPGLSVTAALAGLVGGAKVSLVLGFMAVDAPLLGICGAALAGLAAGFALHRAITLAAPAIFTCLVATGRILGQGSDMLRAFSDGIKLTSMRREKVPPDAAPFPCLLAPRPPSVLMENFDRMAALIEKQPEWERVRFLASLRKKYPVEFFDAVQLKQEDPVLRGAITVRKPLHYRKQKRGLLDRIPGGKP